MITKRTDRLNGRIKKVLLIDDDPAFGKILTQLGPSHYLQIHYINSLSMLEKIDCDRFDGAIIDFELELVSGIRVIEILERQAWKIPVLLVSSYANIDRSKLPSLVKQFICKAQGPRKILETIQNELAERKRAGINWLLASS